jgi:hypothetical protein
MTSSARRAACWDAVDGVLAPEPSPEDSSELGLDPPMEIMEKSML